MNTITIILLSAVPAIFVGVGIGFAISVGPARRVTKELREDLLDLRQKIHAEASEVLHEAQALVDEHIGGQS